MTGAEHLRKLARARPFALVRACVRACALRYRDTWQNESANWKSIAKNSHGLKQTTTAVGPRKTDQQGTPALAAHSGAHPAPTLA